MLNKFLAAVRQYQMVQPGDTVICAVSGGADSMAMLFAMYLLAPKLSCSVEAAHFNHRLRGEESDRDEAFVREFCTGYKIPFRCGTGYVVAGEKGLEAAARDARYAFLKSLPGKIATAHTANDNAETVLLHMIRGTGLKGLGGITPVSDNLIRPMLNITRPEILTFLKEYSIAYVDDSSNQTDMFLRNRIRHHVMPLLERENPRLAENMSAMAQRLREDEAALAELTDLESVDIHSLRQMSHSRRSRTLAAFLESKGVREPETDHIALLDRLVFSDNPSARASFPGGITIARCYDILEVYSASREIQVTPLNCPGETILPQLGLKAVCKPIDTVKDTPYAFSVKPQGGILVRSRREGDRIRLSGGTKSVKKLFIDKKIPASYRQMVPVLEDDIGILGVCGIGANRDRLEPGIEIRFEKTDISDKL